jgi:serine/threonine-protein kinase SIK2
MEKFQLRFIMMDILEEKYESVVYLCKRISDGALVVAKIYNKERMKLVNIIRLQNEGTIATLMEGAEGQIQKINYVEEKGYIFLVIKYYSGGDLLKYLKSNDGKVSIAQKLVFARDIARALNVFHMMGYAHRDIKLENIFLDEDLTPKLGDYGYSCPTKLTYRPEPVGSSAYAAPEVIHRKSGSEPIDLQVTDLFSLGVLFYIMFCMRLPFGGETQSEMLQRKHMKPMTKIDRVPIGMHMLIMGLLKMDPGLRPSWDQILAPQNYLEDPFV